MRASGSRRARTADTGGGHPRPLAGRTWRHDAGLARHPLSKRAVGGESAVQEHSQPVCEISLVPPAGDGETGDQVGGEQRPEQLRRAAGGPGLGEDALAGEPPGDPSAGGALISSDQRELAELRRENRRLRQDVEILKRATAIFATATG